MKIWNICSFLTFFPLGIADKYEHSFEYLCAQSKMSFEVELGTEEDLNLSLRNNRKSFSNKLWRRTTNPSSCDHPKS